MSDLQPSSKWFLARNRAAERLGDSWTDSSACESEVQDAALLVDLRPVKSPISVKKRLSKLLRHLV